MKYGIENPSYRKDLDKNIQLLTNEDIINKQYTFKKLEELFIADSRTIKKRLSKEQIKLIKQNQYIINSQKHSKEFNCKYCNQLFNRKQSNIRYFCSKKCQKQNKGKSFLETSERMKKNNPMFNEENVKKMFETQHKYNIKQKSSYEKRFDKNMIDEDLEFVGDGKIWLTNMNPDYRIIKQKKCIEISSNWYYRDENYAKSRIKKSNGVKWECLVIFLEHTDKKTNYNIIKKVIERFKKNNFSGWIDKNGKFTKN